MKTVMKQLNNFLLSVALFLSFTFPVFAEEAVKYSNELTVSPLRIFFAVLIIPAFVVMELAFEKIREKRIEKRNRSYEKDEK